MSILRKDSLNASEGINFDPECDSEAKVNFASEAKVKFAYNHNSDIDAWVHELHQQADELFNY